MWSRFKVAPLLVASFSREAGQILSVAPFVLPLRKPVRMLPRSGEPYLLPNRPLHVLRLRPPPPAFPHMRTPWQVAEVLRRLDGSTTSAWRSP